MGLQKQSLILIIQNQFIKGTKLLSVLLETNSSIVHCAASLSCCLQILYDIQNHSAEKSFICFLCNKSFSRGDCLIEHSKTHTGEKPFSCSLCSKSFARCHHLTRHLRTHRRDTSRGPSPPANPLVPSLFQGDHAQILQLSSQFLTQPLIIVTRNYY